VAARIVAPWRIAGEAGRGPLGREAQGDLAAP
jgi:hypothetical protein